MRFAFCTLYGWLFVRGFAGVYSGGICKFDKNDKTEWKRLNNLTIVIFFVLRYTVVTALYIPQKNRQAQMLWPVKQSKKVRNAKCSKDC